MRTIAATLLGIIIGAATLAAITSQATTVDTEVRVIVRPLQDGRSEFGIRTPDGDQWPTSRFLPARATVERRGWVGTILPSSPVTISTAIPASPSAPEPTVATPSTDAETDIDCAEAETFSGGRYRSVEINDHTTCADIDLGLGRGRSVRTTVEGVRVGGTASSVKMNLYCNAKDNDRSVIISGTERTGFQESTMRFDPDGDLHWGLSDDDQRGNSRIGGWDIFPTQIQPAGAVPWTLFRTLAEADFYWLWLPLESGVVQRVGFDLRAAFDETINPVAQYFTDCASLPDER